MKISFSTLSCPSWNWERIVDEAARLGYEGIEVRGVEGELFLPKVEPFLEENIEKTITRLKTKKIEICSLDTSCQLCDLERYDEYIAEGKATIDLAQRINAKFIRVFGNVVRNERAKHEMLETVTKGIKELCNYSKDRNVSVLLETHGGFSNLSNIMFVLENIESPFFGILWDFEHTYEEYGENIEEFFSKVHKHIKYVHIKDAKKIGDKFQLCQVGEGSVSIGKNIQLLKSVGYNGYLSLEWEKKWCPELDEPEIALPEYMEFIKKHINI